VCRDNVNSCRTWLDAPFSSCGMVNHAKAGSGLAARHPAAQRRITFGHLPLLLIAATHPAQPVTQRADERPIEKDDRLRPTARATLPSSNSSPEGEHNASDKKYPTSHYEPCRRFSVASPKCQERVRMIVSNCCRHMWRKKADEVKGGKVDLFGDRSSARDRLDFKKKRAG
jgi:hypothetical protein